MGVWLAAGTFTAVTVSTWFLVGCFTGACWALHPSTAPRYEGQPSNSAAACFVLISACLYGTAFALFRPAGRFIIGGMSSVMVCRCMSVLPLGDSPFKNLTDITEIDIQLIGLIFLATVGFCGSVFTYTFEKTALCGLSSLAGGFGLATVLLWWGRWGWLVLRGAEERDTVLGNWVRLFPNGEGDVLEYFFFSVLWVIFTVVGITAQRFIFEKLWLPVGGQAQQLPGPNDTDSQWAVHYQACSSPATPAQKKSTSESTATPSLTTTGAEQTKAATRGLSAEVVNQVPDPEWVGGNQGAGSDNC